MLFRYFLFHVTRTVAMVLSIVIGLFFILTLLENLGDAESVAAALQTSLLEMPKIAHAAIPASAALGCAVALAILDGRREMALLRLIGISQARIVWWLLVSSVLWVAGYLAFTEMVLPETSRISRDIEVQRSGSLITTEEVIWMRTSDGFASVGHLAPDGTQVRNLWLFTKDGDNFSQMRWAQQANYSDGGWNLHGIEIATLEDGNWEFSKAASMPWLSGPDPSLFVSFSIPPDSLPMQRLLELSDALRELEENTSAVDLIIWSRLFDALAIVELMLASLLLVRYRTGSDARTVRATTALALLVVLLYHYFQLIVRQHGVEQNWPGIAGAAIPPIFAALLLGALVLWNAQAPRRKWRRLEAQGSGSGA